MKHVIVGVFLAGWGVATVGVTGLLMVNHTVPMPGPQSATRLADGLSMQLGAVDVVHLLPARCSCTDGLVRHLAERGADGDEVVVFVGEPAERHRILAERGFVWDAMSTEALTDLGVEALPLLVAWRDGEPAYVGGYFDHPSAIHSRDEDLLDAVRAGDDPTPLPLYGCAISDSLQQRIDPLGLQR